MKAVAHLRVESDDGRVIELYRDEESDEEGFYIGEWAYDLLNDLRELFLGIGIDIKLGDDE